MHDVLREPEHILCGICVNVARAVSSSAITAGERPPADSSSAITAVAYSPCCWPRDLHRCGAEGGAGVEKGGAG